MLNLLSKNAFRKFLRDPANATRKGLEKIATHFAANALDGWSPFPTNITFFLTYRCNLRCNVCGQWGVSGYVKGFSGKELRDEVDIDTLKRRIDEIASEKTAITLCGGEVLLYKQWFEFMSHVKSKGLECVLTTNGSMLEANARKLVEIGLDKLSLSLDGPEAVHNAARGAPDIFGKAMRGLQAVNRWKKELGSTTPVLEIGCTISDQNYKHLDEVVAIAETLDVSCLIFLHLAFLRDEEFSSQSRLFRELFDVESVHWSGYRYMPGAMDLEYLADKVAELKNRDGKFPIIIHPDFTREEILDYYTKPFFRSKSYTNKCLAPWTSVYVLPNGDVSPCSSFVAGNIRKESFKSIWNNQKFKDFRKILREKELFPACIRCCELYKH